MSIQNIGKSCLRTTIDALKVIIESYRENLSLKLIIRFDHLKHRQELLPKDDGPVFKERAELHVGQFLKTRVRQYKLWVREREREGAREREKAYACMFVCVCVCACVFV
jgi:hypothetical protein